MEGEAAETRNLQPLLSRVGAALDQFLRFEHPDATARSEVWRSRLDGPLPQHGGGIGRHATLSSFLWMQLLATVLRSMGKGALMPAFPSVTCEGLLGACAGLSSR